MIHRPSTDYRKRPRPPSGSLPLHIIICHSTYIDQNTLNSIVQASGVPQESALGPLVFVLYINDIDEWIVSKISKFADDTKLCARV